KTTSDMRDDALGVQIAARGGNNVRRDGLNPLFIRHTDDGDLGDAVERKDRIFNLAGRHHHPAGVDDVFDPVSFSTRSDAVKSNANIAPTYSCMNARWVIIAPHSRAHGRPARVPRTFSTVASAAVGVARTWSARASSTIGEINGDRGRAPTCAATNDIGDIA